MEGLFVVLRFMVRLPQRDEVFFSAPILSIPVAPKPGSADDNPAMSRVRQSEIRLGPGFLLWFFANWQTFTRNRYRPKSGTGFRHAQDANQTFRQRGPGELFLGQGIPNRCGSAVSRFAARPC